ncbi:CGNR zinc finger domain-containing protein [Bradyrhizobium sp. CCBAU 45384]|uniref:CGNR zinc finger domain-containing protein n=1 Tax=Bradyrhizobium sp. CCBAU 45384 TaxID=858428 RepID=UPI0023051504|nr:CGNR zinc finger domain-containing protein [Bradyrhizobium sp. CCBAU 45384]
MSAQSRTRTALPPSRAGSLDLVGGELAWDFTNTSSARGLAAHQEHLRDFDTLMQWVEHARVMPPSDCAYIRSTLSGHPRRARRIFERAIEIRELIWTIGTALAEQRPVSARLLDLLSAAHAANLRHAEMRMRLGSYIWVFDPRRDIEAAILGPITLSALTLLMEKDLLRTRRCAGQECGWLFFDTTKNNGRRWCEMRVCGNRAKVRAARDRQRRTPRQD